MALEELYECIGDFGFYQKRILLLLSLLCIPSGFYAVFPVFGDTEPQSWSCGLHSTDLSEEQKCKQWDSGNCQPHYEAERQTTVTEVFNYVCHQAYCINGCVFVLYSPYLAS